LFPACPADSRQRSAPRPSPRGGRRLGPGGGQEGGASRCDALQSCPSPLRSAWPRRRFISGRGLALAPDLRILVAFLRSRTETVHRSHRPDDGGRRLPSFGQRLPNKGSARPQRARAALIRARPAPVGQRLPGLGTTLPKTVSLCPAWASSAPKGQAFPGMGRLCPAPKSVSDRRNARLALRAPLDRPSFLEAGRPGDRGLRHGTEIQRPTSWRRATLPLRLR
jgi:hypothetical protein